MDTARGLARPFASTALAGAATGLAGYGAYRAGRFIKATGHRVRRKVGLRRRRGTKG